MEYTVEDIRRLFDSGTFARGQAYAREGKVRKFGWTKNGCDGEVSGSGRSIYHQNVRVTRKGSYLDIAGSCSCPMDYNCKHVVAVLVEALKRSPALLAPKVDSAPAVASGTFSGETARWLNMLALAKVMHRSDVPAMPAKRVAGVAWVIVPDAQHGGVHLYPCKTRLLANGKIAGASVIAVHDLLVRTPDAMLPGDERAARLYVALAAGNGGHLDLKPSGELGAMLCSSFVRTSACGGLPTASI